MATAKWYVLSPKYDYTEVICEYGGPTYEIQDYVEVEADTRDEAVVKGVAAMEQWPDIARGDGVNPFIGVKAYVICRECENHQDHSSYMWSCLICGDTNMALGIWNRINDVSAPIWNEQWIITNRLTKRQRTRRILKWEREHVVTE